MLFMAMSKALKDEIYKPYIHPKWRYAFYVCAKRCGREITALFVNCSLRPPSLLLYHASAAGRLGGGLILRPPMVWSV